ncbi:MAG: glycosyltransferase family 4 protein [Candidatus Bathyarchaeia archaeon]
MKIALTLYNSNFLGGGNKFTAELLKAFREKGFKVALCSGNKPLKGKCHEELLEIDEIYSSKLFKPMKKGKIYVSTFLIALAIKKCLKKFKPDVIINADSPPAVFTLIKRKNEKFIQYVHWPTELQRYRHSMFLEIYRSIYWGLHYKALKLLDAVVCNSEYTRRITQLLWSKEVSFSKFYTIYPFIDLKRFERAKAQKELKACYVGRLDENKGIDMVIDAFIDVKKEIPEAKLEIAGAVNIGDTYTSVYYPKLKARLEKLSDPSISLKVNLSDDEIAHVYKSSRCFVNFNPSEHFGICVIEALASGAVPVVAKGGGQEETIIDGKTGFLVKNMEEMKTCMKLILTSEDVFMKMSNLAIESSKSFSKEKMIEKWIKLLEKLLSE